MAAARQNEMNESATVVATITFVAAWRSQVGDVRTDAAGKGHLRQSDRQATLAQIVAGADETLLQSGMQAAENARGQLQIRHGWLPGLHTVNHVIMRSAQLVPRRADQEE